MSPLSDDPAKRERQLANLRRGGPANAGSFRPGQPSPNLKHGLRSREPGRLILGEAGREIVEALSAGVPLRDEHGDVPIYDRAAVEAAALHLIIVRRCLGYLSAHGFEDARGRLRPEIHDLGKANERLERSLDRLGMTPAGRARLGLDLVRAEREQEDLALRWARQDDQESRAAGGDAIEGEASDG